MGFYKKDTDTILTGENFVFSPIVTLTKETKDDYTYPQDGWYYFESEEEAYSFFGLELPKQEEHIDEFTLQQYNIIT